METVKVKIINKSNNPTPAYSTEDSAGMDVRAFVNEPITLNPLERVLVPTGLYMELPQGYQCEIRPRSGLALKKGITVLNTPGTIDSDYRGEIGVILINCGTKSFLVKRGDRIAQMVINRYERINWCECEVLDETERADGGFGHSGV